LMDSAHARTDLEDVVVISVRHLTGVIRTNNVSIASVIQRVLPACSVIKRLAIVSVYWASEVPNAISALEVSWGRCHIVHLRRMFQ
ncbi:unnamed protein product, partial [Ilex paraguariensis]